MDHVGPMVRFVRWSAHLDLAFILPGLDLQSNKSTGKIQKLKEREGEREIIIP